MRSGLRMNKLIELLRNFEKKTVLVIGDYCVDEYLEGDVQSIAPEAPVPRVRIGNKWVRMGAAGNVVLGIRALGARTFAAGIIGDDAISKELVKNLEEHVVHTEGLVFQKGRITPKFSRILAGGVHYPKQHVIRFDAENEEDVREESVKSLIEFIRNNSEEFDAIIVADYDEVDKGVIKRELLDAIVKVADEKGIILIGDSRKNLANFKGFTSVVPNIFEAELAYGRMIGQNEDDIFNAGKELIENLNLKSILITRDKDGMDLIEKEGDEFKRVSIPILSKNVVDVTGAGDSVTCAFTLGLCSSGKDFVSSANLANHAASITIGKEGVVTVTKEELNEAIKNE
jgi:rfaE bifunctional protein kinase chain/domain